MELARPLKQETTFCIGGSAEYFVPVATEEDIRDALAHAALLKKEVTLLAGGSNVLIADDGIEGVVLHMNGGEWKLRGTTLHVQAGVNLTSIVRETAVNSVGGWEDLAGIPGTVGGAVRGNAGAFSAEMASVLKEVRAIDRSTGHVRTFSTAQCQFTYRSSYFKTHPEWLLLDAVFTLRDVVQQHAVARIEKTIAERERRHLQNVRAAGSFFMNPLGTTAIVELFEAEKNVTAREGRVPAGWLIEKAGMTGSRVGGAMVSTAHANYLLNESGNATAKEVWQLAQRVAQKVKDHDAIELSPEVSCLGALDAFPPLV